MKTCVGVAIIVEQHLVSCLWSDLLKAGGRRDARTRAAGEVGQLAATGILDDATRVSVEGVRNATLHLRHIVLAVAVGLPQMHL